MTSRSRQVCQTEIGAQMDKAEPYLASKWDQVPREPGFYSIFVDDPANLPCLADCLRNTSRLYIGIASRSLFSRLVRQDLRHKQASTFFRGIGAVLGFRPEPGSLAGMRNRNNYKFSQADTEKITKWICLHLAVRFIEVDNPCPEDEKELIGRYRPVLNWSHNPGRLACLRELRSECRRIARGGK